MANKNDTIPALPKGFSPVAAPALPAGFSPMGIEAPVEEEVVTPGLTPEQQRGEVLAGSASEDSYKSEILNQYPAFKNVFGEEGENLEVVEDSAFTEGFGDIEFFSPTQEKITYGEDRVRDHPSPGKYAVLLNPDKMPPSHDKRYEAVLGDMLHGMSDDPEFAALK